MRVYAITDKEKIDGCRAYLKATNKRNYIMFEIGLKTLLRISDILELRVKDVYKRDTIRKRIKKTGRYQEIPIRTDLRKILNEYCEGKPSYEYLIKSRQGVNNPISIVQAYRIIKEMAEYMNVNRVGTHTLRKTGAYHMFKTTKDADFVRRMLGQTTKEQVFNYIYSGMESDRDLINKAKF